jgi:ribulose-phosphate 3-epimerase
LVAPSLLSANFANMAAGVKQIVEAGGDWVHLDVMDGMFVPTITFGPQMIKDIRLITELPFDVHLMIERPENHIDAFAEAGADYISFHLEAVVHGHRLIQRIKNRGKHAGISIVPSTPADHLEEVLPMLDLILIMTVNPGFGGQKIIPRCLEKVKKLKRLREKHGYSYLLSVDGGIDRYTCADARAAGSDVLVSGSAFFSAENPAEEVRILKGESFAE